MFQGLCMDALFKGRLEESLVHSLMQPAAACSCKLSFRGQALSDIMNN